MFASITSSKVKLVILTFLLSIISFSHYLSFCFVLLNFMTSEYRGQELLQFYFSILWFGGSFSVS